MKHSNMSQLAQELPTNSLLVFNNTKVFASRIIGKLSSGSSIEIFLNAKPGLQCGWNSVPCFLKPARKVSVETKIFLDKDFYVTVIKMPPKGIMDTATLDFSTAPQNFMRWLTEHAFVPLPPYIKREKKEVWGSSNDSMRYQTIYGKNEGSVAAPTAGLHFTEQTLQNLKARGIETCEVTLHVGSGTFLPVRTENIADHRMHEESYYIPSVSWEKIQKAKQERRPIIAVGTTSLRCIESFLRDSSQTTDRWLKTDLFIYPKHEDDIYHSTIFDGILTNFHQPCSTLLMLISSLIGLSTARAVYEEAIAKKYRLFSYGDTSLLWF